MTLEKAYIRNLTDGGEPVTCQFRPTTYTYAKDGGWQAGNPAIGKSFTPPTYKGGGPMTFTLGDLIFDTYEAPPGMRDVRRLTNPLWKWMQVTTKKKENGTNKSEPPDVEFRWGKKWSFKAVISKIEQTFTLFDPDGTPVRCTLKISFLKAIDDSVYPGTNPTSGGYGGYAVHTVLEGETIDLIAFQEYGSSNAWRYLAARNNLDDPMRLRPGQQLVLYPIEG